MANKSVALVWLCKTPDGWKRYPVLFGGNGRIKPGRVRIDGKVQHFPDGKFQLREYMGKKTVYMTVEGGSSDALVALRKREGELIGKAEAEAAGLKVLEPESRLRLTTELAKFVEATQAKGSEYAAGVYRGAAEDFISISGRKYADEIIREDITKFHAALRKRGNGDRTVRNRHDRLMAFFRYLQLPVKTLAPGKPTYEEGLPEVYTDAELSALFDGLEDDSYHHLAFELLLKSGMRDAEAVHLPWRNLNFERNTIRIRSVPEYKFKVKDKEQRDIPLPPELMEKLRARRKEQPDDFLVLQTGRGKPNRKLLRSLKAIANRLDLACRQCDKCVEREECEHWFLHKFRATYITKLLRSGMDLRTVMKLSGHSDLESVMRYLSPPTNAAIRKHIDGMTWIQREPAA